MEKQFFGRTFRYGLLISLILYISSIFLFHSYLSLYVLLILILAALLISLRKLEYGLYFAFLELFITSHGHLITVEVFSFPLSLRMAIFIGVMLAWLLTVILRSERASDEGSPRFNIHDQRLKWYLPLFLAILIGAISGIISNDLTSVFQDGNGYLFILYLLPVLSVQWDNKKLNNLLQILTAGVVWTIFVTYILLYIFSHFGTSILSVVYLFVRDSRVAEVTRMIGDFHRVFLQSHFFVVIFGFILSSQFLVGQKFCSRWMDYLLFGSVIAIFILSLSRSFWVGAFVAVLAFLLFAFKTNRLSKKEIFSYFSKHVLASITAVVIICFVVLVPIPSQKIDSGALSDLFKDRAQGMDDAGISSRWKLLTPMLDLVKERPIFGNGFGQTVTFENDDPRARSISPDGTWTTFAMEWGWVELWLKMGILGPLAFLYLFYHLFKQLSYYFWTERSWIGLSLIASLTFLYATHTFSPYLNHPIGLGFLLFVTAFLATPKGQGVSIKEVLPSLKKKTQTQVVLTLKN